jgi:photosystem II stability/assembly factor-like uncharacterized protein
MKRIPKTILALFAGAALLPATALGGEARPAARAVEAMRLASPQKAPLVAVHRQGKRWVAVGDYGTILLSTDSGASWMQARSVPFAGLLTAVTMADERTGWAVGHGGTILRTEDGGERWTVQARLDGGPVLLSVLAADARRVLVVGAYGTAQASADGGTTWTPLRVASGRDGDRHINHAFMVGTTTYLSAEGGAAYRARQDWSRWEPVATGVSGSLWGGLATRDGGVVLYGMSGRVIYSRDQGEHWQPVDTGLAQSLTDAVELPDGRLVVVGNGGALAVGTPGRGSLAGSVLPDRRNVHAVAAGPDGRLALFGAFGVAAHALPK